MFMHSIPFVSLNDLVLEDERLHVSQHPPEHDKDRQVLDPSKLDKLPEPGGIDHCEGRICQFNVNGEVSRLPTIPYPQRLV